MEDLGEKNGERKDSGKLPETDYGDKKINAPERKMRGQMEIVPNPDLSNASSSHISSPVGQLIYEMPKNMPRTKSEYLAYPVNWDIYDKDDHLQEEMRVYISKATGEFLGKQNLTGNKASRRAFINNIVNCIRQHTSPTILLDSLKCTFESLDDQKMIETFFLKIWHKLIYRIRDIERKIEIEA